MAENLLGMIITLVTSSYKWMIVTLVTLINSFLKKPMVSKIILGKYKILGLCKQTKRRFGSWIQ